MSALGTAASGAPAPRVKARVAWRLRAALSGWLPLLLMGLLAAGTWWLVKNTPIINIEREAAGPRHVPDYTMRQFSVQRFGADGALRVQIEGEVMHHYPDTDTLEVDNVRIRALGPEGHVTVATARRAVSNGAATEVTLQGGAQVLREATATEPAVEIRGEFLQVFLDSEQVRSHLPVTLRQGGTELRADTLDYDNRTQVVQFKGRVRAVFLTRNRAATPQRP